MRFCIDEGLRELQPAKDLSALLVWAIHTSTSTLNLISEAELGGLASEREENSQSNLSTSLNTLSLHCLLSVCIQ